MRHQAGDVARLVADAGNVIQRTIRVGAFGGLTVGISITPQNLILLPELGERLLIGKIAAFTVRNRDAQEFPRRNAVGKRGIGGGGFEENMLAAELERAVADERAGEQAGLA